MIRNEHQYLVNVLEEIEPEEVSRDDGWLGLRIRFLNGDESGSENTCLFRATFPPGATHDKHTHPNADEFFYVISGRAAVGGGEEEHEVGEGTVQFVPAGKVHWLRNLDDEQPVEVIGVYVGGSSLEEAGYVVHSD